MAKIRIDKYLADAGFGSRKDVKGLLKAKQVTINGETCVHAEEKLEPAQDVVCVQGKMVVYESFSYYMLHKPQGSCLQRKMHMKNSCESYYRTKTTRFISGRTAGQRYGRAVAFNQRWKAVK